MKTKQYLKKMFSQDRPTKRQVIPLNKTKCEIVLSIACVGSSAELPIHVSREVFYSGKIQAVEIRSARSK